jgi:hypothetical protein
VASEHQNAKTIAFSSISRNEKGGVPAVVGVKI